MKPVEWVNPTNAMMIAIGGPPLAWIVVSTAWLVVSAANPSAFDSRAMTLTETMAISSYADAGRLLRSGADPNAPGRMRAGIVDLSTHMLTPLEAATGAVRNGPVDMLVEHGAVINEQNYSVLWCAALARANRNMQQFLQSRSPSSTPVDCSRVRSLW
jgi:hypothetical protein